MIFAIINFKGIRYELLFYVFLTTAFLQKLQQQLSVISIIFIMFSCLHIFNS